MWINQLTPEQAFWISILVGLLIGAITLLLLYLVIRLAITHGMLSYARHRDEEQKFQRYVDERQR
jgi:uncharacterized membrane protein YedE/YeeE